MYQPNLRLLRGQCGSLAEREREWHLLYAHYHPQLLAYLYHRTSDVALAAELAHDTLQRVSKYLNTFGGGNFDAWVRKIATNLTRDRLATLSFEHLTLEEARGDPALQEPSSEGGVLGSVEIRRRRALLERLLHRLSPQERSAIRLAYAGFSHEEIAAMLKITVGSSRVLRARAVQHLREMVASADQVHEGIQP